MDHGLLGSSMTLAEQGYADLGEVYYNATEADLVAHGIRRNEGELGKGGMQTRA